MLKTLEESYLYEFHICFDHDDPVYIRESTQRRIVEMVSPHRLYFHMFPSRKNRIPLNELLAKVHETGAEYIVRVNDDTEFLTSNWTSMAVETLLNNKPPNSELLVPWGPWSCK